MKNCLHGIQPFPVVYRCVIECDAFLDGRHEHTTSAKRNVPFLLWWEETLNMNY